jgi:hypothetical protein
MDSAGAASKRYQFQLDSIEARINTLIATWEKMVNRFNQGNTFKNIVDLGTNLIEILDFLINDMNVLSTIVLPITIYTGLKQITTHVQDAIAGMKLFKTAIESINDLQIRADMVDGFISPDKIDAVSSAISTLTAKQQAMILSSQGVNAEQQIQILTSNGVTQAEAQQAVQSAAVSAGNQTIAATAGSAAVAMNLLNIALLAVTAAITIGVVYTQKQKEMIENARTAATELQQQNQRISESIESVKGLRKEMDLSTTSEERQKEIKKELIGIQRDLNEQYFGESEVLNLVGDNIEYAIAQLKEYRKEQALAFKAANLEAIEKTREEVEKIRNFQIGSFYDVDSIDQNLKEIIDRYELFEYTTKNIIDETYGFLEIFARTVTPMYEVPELEMTLSLDVTAEEAYEQLSSMFAEVDALVRRYESQNEEIPLSIESVWRGLSDALEYYENNLREIVELNRMNMEQTIASVEEAYEPYEKLQAAINSVNEAMALSDNEENISAALQTVIDIMPEVESAMESFPEYNILFEEMLNSAAVFAAELENTDSIRAYAEQLQELELTGDDLRNMYSDDGIVQDGETAFEALKVAAEGYGLSVESVISVLQRLGYLQSNEIAASVMTMKDVMLDTSNSLGVLDNNFTTLSQAIEDFSTLGYITADSLKALTENDLLQYLELTENGFVLNTSALDEERNALIEAAEASLKTSAAQEIMAIITSGVTDEMLEAQKASEDTGNAVATMGNDFISAADGVTIAVGAMMAYRLATGDTTTDLGDYKNQIDGVINRLNDNIDALNRVSLGNDHYTQTLRNNASASRDAASATNDLTQSLSQAKSAIESLLNMTMSMLKQDYQNRLDSVQAELDAITNRYNAEKSELESIKKARDAAYNEEKSRINDAKKETEQRYKDEIDYIKDMSKEMEDAYNKQIKAIKEEIEDRKDAYAEEKERLKDEMEAAQDIYKARKTALQDELKERKKIYEEEKKAAKAEYDERQKIYKVTTESLKKELSDRKEMYKEIKAQLKEEYDARKEIYDADKKALEDQLDGYRETINAELELIRLKDSERSYQQDIDKNTGELSGLQNQLSLLDNDDSLEAQRKRMELLDQINEKQQEIDELQYNRGKELSENALNDELSRFEKQTNSKLGLLEQEWDAYVKIYETRVSQLEKEQEQFEKNINAQLELLQAEWEKYQEIYNSYIANLEEEMELFTENINSQIELLDLEWEKYKEGYDAIIEQMEDEQKLFEKNMEDQIEALEKKRDLEKEAYDERIAQLEDEREQWSRYYEEQLEQLEEEKRIQDENHASALADLEEEYQATKNKKEKEIQDLQKQMNDEVAIREKAISLIEGRSDEFYQKLIEWNRLYGSHIDGDVIATWNRAYTELDRFNYKQIGVQNILEQIVREMYLLEQNTASAAEEFDRLAEAAERAADAVRDANNNSNNSNNSNSNRRSTNNDIDRWHSGTNYVTKRETPFDRELGVKQNETLAILEEGEAVIDKNTNLERLSGSMPVSGLFGGNNTYNNNTPTYQTSSSSNTAAFSFNFGNIVCGVGGNPNDYEALKKGLSNEIFDNFEKHLKLTGFRNMKIISQK